MNRRNFLRGLLALPFVGVAVKHSPPQWGWMASSNFAPSSSRYLGIGTLDRYKPYETLYVELRGIQLKPGDTISLKFVRTGA